MKGNMNSLHDQPTSPQDRAKHVVDTLCPSLLSARDNIVRRSLIWHPNEPIELTPEAIEKLQAAFANLFEECDRNNSGVVALSERIHLRDINDRPIDVDFEPLVDYLLSSLHPAGSRGNYWSAYESAIYPETWFTSLIYHCMREEQTRVTRELRRLLLNVHKRRMICILRDSGVSSIGTVFDVKFDQATWEELLQYQELHDRFSLAAIENGKVLSWLRKIYFDCEHERVMQRIFASSEGLPITKIRYVPLLARCGKIYDWRFDPVVWNWVLKELHHVVPKEGLIIHPPTEKDVERKLDKLLESFWNLVEDRAKQRAKWRLNALVRHVRSRLYEPGMPGAARVRDHWVRMKHHQEAVMHESTLPSLHELRRAARMLMQRLDSDQLQMILCTYREPAI